MTELNFKGKEFVYNHHLSVPTRPLEMHPKRGIGTPRLDGNLIIQGDNLHALKALLPTHAGKVDCIFIDPPYNTGNEGWAYNDNVNSPMIKEWLSDNPIGLEDGLRHDKWCAMIWPRLRLLHELLREGGTIFVSIDYNEVQHLRCLMDTIFDEQNFLASIAWQKRTSPEARKRLGQAHDSILVFKKGSKKEDLAKLERDDEKEDDFSNKDDDIRGLWNSTDFSAQNPDPTKRIDQQYKIKLKSGRIISAPPGRCWSTLEPEFKRLRADNRIWFGVEGDSRPRIKTFLNETKGVSSWTWWPNAEVGHNQEAKKEILRILGHSASFDYPKPTRLLSRILSLATDKDSLILDSFAGSGTTGHAVLEANKKDGGNRRFILVEMEDYADKLTAERVRRVIGGYDYNGTLKTELMREKLSWSKLVNAEKMTGKVEEIENLHGKAYNKITKNVKNSELVVVGEKKVAKRAEGLGGEFTYCTLGAPVELDKILTGKTLPIWQTLGAVLFHMATSHPFDLAQADQTKGYLGKQGDQHVWLIYKPQLDWLKSPEAALSLPFAREVAASAPEDRHLVFAPARHVSRKMLDDQNLKVEFAPLPFSLYRVERD